MLLFQFIHGDDALLSLVENGPSVDVPTLKRPSHDGPLDGHVQQYRRTRFLDMDCIAANLRTTVRMLEDSSNNWQKEGIPMKWKVNSASINLNTTENFSFNS